MENQQTQPSASPSQPQQYVEQIQPQPMVESDGFQAMIPTKNVPSLVSYYCGVFSFIPFVGIILCIAGILFGIKALNLVKVRPTPGAKVHAIIGIVLCSALLLVHIGFTALVFSVPN
jgi:hypothetical protein